MENQLTELEKVAQREEGLRRRVFTCGNDDLILWSDLSGKLVGFQLSVSDVCATFSDGRLSVHTVDSCEKDNLAPVLRGSPDFDPEAMLAWLNDHGSLVDEEVKDYITAKFALHGKRA